MKLSLNWLQDYIQLNIPTVDIAKALTGAGLEVEGIEVLSGGFDGVVVAEVLSTEKHPDADKLCIAQVSDGKETVQVVCGGANCRAGLRTALARVGATLTDDRGEKFKIKKSKLRGVESSGMLCSAKEIHFSKEDQPGIIEFDSTLPLGTDLATLLTDTIIEIGLTPNLWHCNSVVGVARELSAALQEPMVLPAITIQEEQSLHTPGLIRVEILDEKRCPRYACRVIKDVKVGPSPDWMQRRLSASGIRPINNIVDITNYVFLEMGQPLHAFDYDRVAGQKIIVRTAKEGETFVTLDDKLRNLRAEDLLICDNEKAIAIAGVMGGKNSEVNNETKHVLLEAAYFCPKSIRKTSKRLGLQTDSSKRFERGADPNAVLWALDRAAMLMQQIAGGRVAQTPLDIKKQSFPEKIVGCRLNRVNELLGTKLGVSEVESFFKRLGFSYSWDGVDKVLVKVPTYRVDIIDEIDLIEEAARVYGYDNIDKKPPVYHNSNIPHAPIFLFEREVRECLLKEGLQEFLTCDLIGPSLIDLVGGDSLNLEPVKVMNPISIEQSVLRTSLMPGLLNLVKYNFDHQNHSISGFEIGRIHFKAGDQYKEQAVVGLVLSGCAQQHAWYAKEREYDFFDLKGIVENFLKELRIPNVTFQQIQLKTLHTGRQAGVFVGSLEVGSIGEIHPAIIRRLDIPQRIYFAEFNLHDLLSVRKADYRMRDIPVYPGSERDWTITINEKITVQSLLDQIKSLASSLLKEVFLLDIYRSEKLGPDVKNVTLRFIYRDDQKTLSQEAVDTEHTRITKEIITNLENNH